VRGAIGFLAPGFFISAIVFSLTSLWIDKTAAA
jgi:hypothetical protein